MAFVSIIEITSKIAKQTKVFLIFFVKSVPYF